MGITRRGFLQLTGAALVTSVMCEFAEQTPAMAAEPGGSYKLVNVTETATVCCYCSGGCGTIVSVRDDELINVEGDPDHPINRGGLCSKGASQFAVNSVIDPETDLAIINPNRLLTPKVRRAGKTEWEDISWEQAIDELAAKIKKTRDESYEATEEIEFTDKVTGAKTKQMVTVNRCESIASFGAAALDNEEGYALQKLCRGLGMTYIEHQARI
jgi:formate dehydrogenase major subunit